jgi:hypothetical protein
MNHPSARRKLMNDRLINDVSLFFDEVPTPLIKNTFMDNDKKEPCFITDRCMNSILEEEITMNKLFDCKSAK